MISSSIVSFALATVAVAVACTCGRRGERRRRAGPTGSDATGDCTAADCPQRAQSPARFAGHFFLFSFFPSPLLLLLPPLPLSLSLCFLSPFFPWLLASQNHHCCFSLSLSIALLVGVGLLAKGLSLSSSFFPRTVAPFHLCLYWLNLTFYLSMPLFIFPCFTHFILYPNNQGCYCEVCTVIYITLAHCNTCPNMPVG